MSIPSIIHQMWRDEAVPERWGRFRDTWKRHHPRWEHRFWTDQSLRALVADKYPESLEIYDAYPSPVMRADAGRYLLLEQFGGVYADLDTECLQALEPLLAGKSLLLPLEPEVHLASKIASDCGMRRIVGNAWMASVPGHPFWAKLREELKLRRWEPGPLVATGPFMLSDLVARSEPDTAPDLLPSETVYPATNLDSAWLDAREPGTAHWFGPKTYAIHYWDGSWWKKRGKRSKLHLLSGVRPVFSGWLDDGRAGSELARTGFEPLVSCLMVTGRRPGLAALAIEAYRRQSYSRKELVIIDDSGTDSIGAFLTAEDSAIRWIRVPAEGKPLGALRNLALAAADGDLICQWDDDDLSAPARLERQVHVIGVTGAEACGLSKLQLWWPARDWMAISSSRLWECALMWRRGAIAAYPELRSGEDTPPVKQLAERSRVAVIDAPDLYTYIYHGENTFPDQHWLTLWSAASSRSTGKDCRLKLQLMQGLLPCDEYLRTLGLSGLGTAREVVGRAIAASPTAVDRRSIKIPRSNALPRVLVATPIKDAVPFLERFFDNLVATDYPAEKLSIALLESDSRDATGDHAEKFLARHGTRFARIQLMRQDFGFRLDGPRWEPGIQRRRRSILARSRNHLLESALQDEEWVLWIDVDLVSWPKDIIQRLINPDQAIVTPHCVQAPGGPSFDLNAFVFRDRAKQDGSEHWVDGIYQPPRDVTRLYLESFRDRDEVELDGVGGTMLMIPGDLHRDGLRFPARPYRGFLETEGLAFMARDLGVACRGLPKIEIIHS